MVEKYAAEIPDNARKLMDAFWPGSLTIILKIKKGALSKTVTGGLKLSPFVTLTVNQPLILIEEAGVPMVGPSANTSGNRARLLLNTFIMTCMVRSLELWIMVRHG